MNCSVAPDKLAFVVYTNSRDDYCVTARSPGTVMPSTERFLDAVARRCGPNLTNEFSALVAVFRSPDRAETDLALRVFDAGEFLGRPRTLAIVAVEVPRDRWRTWKIAQLLASLSAPVPSDPAYRLPEEERIAQTSVSDEPFKSLNDWEAQLGDRRQGSAVVFSKPPNIELQLDTLLKLSKARSQNRASMRWTTVAITVALFVGLLGWLFWMNRRPPLPRPPTSRYTREELLRVLADSGVALQLDATFEHAAAGIITSAMETNDRTGALAQELAVYASKEPRGSAGTVRHYYQLWRRPIQLESRSDVHPDDSMLDAAIQNHRHYQEIAAALERLEKDDSEGEQFKRDLEALQRLLGIKAGGAAASGRGGKGVAMLQTQAAFS